MKMTDAGEKLWCPWCGKPVGHGTRSLVKQHMDNASHVRNKEAWAKREASWVPSRTTGQAPCLWCDSFH